MKENQKVNNNATSKFFTLLMNNWWLKHLLFWVFVVAYFTWAFGFEKYTPKEALLNSLAYIPGDLLVVYPLLYILIPKFLFKRKFAVFFVGFLLTLIAAKFLSEFIAVQTAANHALRGFHRRQGHFITPFINVASIAAAIKLINYFYFQEKNALIARKIQSEAELELLKSQIHPHFLLNALNSLFDHTSRRSSESPKIVVGLSELLRFMIYESRVEFIPLEEEIQLINNYIHLEKLRFEDELDVSFTYSGEIENKLIRPLILLPLVENSFNHGTHTRIQEKWISLNLHVDGERLLFKVTNSRNPDEKQESDSISELDSGLENVRKRLELLYPNQHTILVREDEDLMNMSLELLLVTNRVSAPGYAFA